MAVFGNPLEAPLERAHHAVRRDRREPAFPRVEEGLQHCDQTVMLYSPPHELHHRAKAKLVQAGRPRRRSCARALDLPDPSSQTPPTRFNRVGFFFCSNQSTRPQRSRRTLRGCVDDEGHMDNRSRHSRRDRHGRPAVHRAARAASVVPRRVARRQRAIGRQGVSRRRGVAAGRRRCRRRRGGWASTPRCRARARSSCSRASTRRSPARSKAPSPRPATSSSATRATTAWSRLCRC